MFNASLERREETVKASSSLRKRYRAPATICEIEFNDLLDISGRDAGPRQAALFPQSKNGGMTVYFAGQLELLQKRCVSVIGAREVTPEGARRARKIAALLCSHDVVVTSGLAKGVDAAAHRGAIENDGKTIAVIGTAIDKAYPAENSGLQEEIYRDHLLISQFAPGTRTFASDFPKRNRLMATLTDASIIVEASDTSGTLHQAAECVRLNRWLFIMKSVVDDERLQWPKKFLNEPKVAVLESIEDVLERIAR